MQRILNMFILFIGISLGIFLDMPRHLESISSQYSHIENTCVPTAIIIQKELTEKGIESHILVLTFWTRDLEMAGHAMTLFRSESGKIIWAWDASGALPIFTDQLKDINDPEEIGKQIVSPEFFISAKWLE